MGENGSFDFAALYELRYACPGKHIHLRFAARRTTLRMTEEWGWPIPFSVILSGGRSPESKNPFLLTAAWNSREGQDPPLRCGGLLVSGKQLADGYDVPEPNLTPQSYMESPVSLQITRKAFMMVSRSESSLFAPSRCKRRL